MPYHSTSKPKELNALGGESGFRETSALKQNMGSRLIATAVVGTLLAAFLALTPIFFPLSGEPGSDWVAALGRFHILALHFPIALLLMVPVFELLGLIKSLGYLKPAARFMLVAAILFAAKTCVLGYLLAAGEGQMSARLDQHLWAGIVTAILMIFALILKEAHLLMKTKPTRALYGLVLLASVASLVAGAHHGAALVHGERYLTEKLPPVLKNTFSRADEPAANASAYHTLIRPIFQAHCYVCHSDVKTKGGFRMDDFAALLEGGDGGMAGIEPGDLDASEVYYRITLDPASKAFMPPDGRAPLSDEEISLIAGWIESGASETAPIHVR